MTNQKTKWIGIAILISVIQSIFKFYTYSLTHSASIYTDAIESIANVLASSFALYAIYLSQLPKDQNHPYGHGKVEYFSSGLEGVMILISGIYVFYETIVGFIQEKKPENLIFGIGFTFISTMINLGYGIFLKNKGKELNSFAMIADGNHLLSDAVTSSSIVIGLILIHFTGFEKIDLVLSIFLSIYLIWNGYHLLRKSIGGLMDETNPKLYADIVNKLNENRKSSWIDIHNLRIIQYGSNYHVDCHLTLPYYLNLEKSHDEVIQFENIIKSHLSIDSEIFTHTDPCLPKCCKSCNLENCESRSEDFKDMIAWTPEKLQKNKKHFE